MKDQNLNVGDKLLCKNDYVINKISIHKGREYEITEILLNAWVVNDGDERFYYIIDDDDCKVEIQRIEELNSFFYTKNEIRKIKLKKLEDFIYEKSES